MPVTIALIDISQQAQVPSMDDYNALVARVTALENAHPGPPAVPGQPIVVNGSSFVTNTAGTAQGTIGTLMSNGTATYTVPANPGATGNLAIVLSGDNYQGDPIVTITVDGTQFNGNIDVSASHAAGKTQTVTIPNVDVTKSHTVAISFTNDLYAGSPATDRNAYVHSLTIS